LIFFTFLFDCKALYATSFIGDDGSEEFLHKPRRSKFKRQRLGSQTFYLEGGYFYGYYKGLRYSLNYDGILQADETNALSIRLGVGYSQATNDSTVVGQEVFFPVSIHVFFGKKNHFDIGLGGYYFENRQVITPMLFIGFRHQNPKGGIMYRIGADIHLERVYDLKGKDLQKTAVYGPLVSVGWSF
jgi:hypothetical protein